MRLGNVDLYSISDGVHWSDGAGMFGLVPKALWERIIQSDHLNRIPLHLRCLLIDTGTHRILVDTGLGDKLSPTEREQNSLVGERRLVGSLAALGVRPEDIDLVINTHLHNDHCGGNTVINENGELVPTFPRATYCVQRLELADAMFPNERTQATYRRQNWELIERAGRLRVLWGDTRLTDEVRVVVTPGHTRAHQCVVIESKGQTAMFMGDLASWPVHLERLAWVPAYDVEPLVSIETKRSVARWAVEHHVLLFFEHHPHVVAGYLYAVEQPGRFRFEPIELA